MHRKFKPVLTYLHNHMTALLQKPIGLKLRIFKDYQQANDAIVHGKVDFVRFGPASYVKAKGCNAKLELIAMEERQGQHFFYGVIIVPTNSKVQTLAQLKGSRFAFGNQRSTIGRYLSQAALVEVGIQGKDLASFDYLGRHDKVFKVVALGHYEAGAVKETTVARYNQHGEVRIIHSFQNVTKPWIARAGLDGKIMHALKKSLLNLSDVTILKELKISGFLPTSDAHYEVTRQGMRLAKQF